MQCGRQYLLSEQWKMHKDWQVRTLMSINCIPSQQNYVPDYDLLSTVPMMALRSLVNAPLVTREIVVSFVPRTFSHALSIA
jgi:hypothetical protein